MVEQKSVGAVEQKNVVEQNVGFPVQPLRVDIAWLDAASECAEMALFPGTHV